MSVRDLIKLKQSDQPYIFSQTNVITQPERAYFPYPNFWRGDYKSSRPIVVEREAGFRPREDPPYESKRSIGHAYPDHCFEAAPSTIYPCYPECTEEFKRYRRYMINYAKIYLFR